MEIGYLGLDVGTSGCKAAVISGEGKVLARAYREYGFESPFPGAVELNPITVWEKVKETLQEVGRAEAEIRSMAVSSIGEAPVLINREGNVLYNGLVYLDQRGEETCKEIIDAADPGWLYETTGVPVNPMYTLNRLLWFQKERPKVLEQTAHCFLFGDYVNYKLTGEKVIDPSSASRTMLFDAKERVWAEKIGSIFQVPLQLFSEVVPTGTRIGRIQPEIARQTGLPEKLPVIMGCHDQCSALLGSGAVCRGDIMAGEGSTESINLIIEKKDFSPAFYENQLCFEPYLEPEQYLIPVGQLAHGLSIRWFVENFGEKGGAEDRYERANAACAEDSRDVYFLPYLSRVKSMDAKNRALGTYLGLDINTKKDVMYRALLEGLCFESRKSLEILEKVNLPIHRITASGGCSRSELFMQMKADVLKRKICILQNPDAGSLGLALICAVADGYYSSYREGAGALVRVSKTYAPEKDYEARYARYREISKAVQELYTRL